VSRVRSGPKLHRRTRSSAIPDTRSSASRGIVARVNRGYSQALIEGKRDNELGHVACFAARLVTIDAPSLICGLGAGGTMQQSGKSALARNVAVDHDEHDLNVLRLQPVTGGEPRTSQLTGTKALMLAVLEDGIRSYLGGSRLIAQDADYWIHSPKSQSPFSFVVVCEMLGLDPDAVRATLGKMKSANVSARKALPRARHNVRIPGKVYARKSS